MNHKGLVAARADGALRHGPDVEAVTAVVALDRACGRLFGHGPVAGAGMHTGRTDFAPEPAKATARVLPADGLRGLLMLDLLLLLLLTLLVDGGLGLGDGAGHFRGLGADREVADKRGALGDHEPRGDEVALDLGLRGQFDLFAGREVALDLAVHQNLPGLERGAAGGAVGALQLALGGGLARERAEDAGAGIEAHLTLDVGGGPDRGHLSRWLGHVNSLSIPSAPMHEGADPSLPRTPRRSGGF